MLVHIGGVTIDQNTQKMETASFSSLSIFNKSNPREQSGVQFSIGNQTSIFHPMMSPSAVIDVKEKPRFESPEVV